jgi:hypothetical protein
VTISLTGAFLPLVVEDVPRLPVGFAGRLDTDTMSPTDFAADLDTVLAVCTEDGSVEAFVPVDT